MVQSDFESWISQFQSKSRKILSHKHFPSFPLLSPLFSFLIKIFKILDVHSDFYSNNEPNISRWFVILLFVSIQSIIFFFHFYSKHSLDLFTSSFGSKHSNCSTWQILIQSKTVCQSRPLICAHFGAQLI